MRKRPSVIFGSDGFEGCQHAVLKSFQTQLMRREGFGSRIIVTFKDGSSEVQISAAEDTGGLQSK